MKADFRLERTVFRAEKADLRLEGADFKPEGEDIDKQMNKSPPVFYRTSSPSGPLHKKEKKERTEKEEKKKQRPDAGLTFKTINVARSLIFLALLPFLAISI